MAKKQEAKEPKLVKVMLFTQNGIEYGLKVIEINESDLLMHGKVVESTQPDIFPIFINQLVMKCREFFGL